MIRSLLRRWLGVGDSENVARDGNWVESTFAQKRGGAGPARTIEFAFMTDGTMRWRLKPSPACTCGIGSCVLCFPIAKPNPECL